MRIGGRATNIKRRGMIGERDDHQVFRGVGKLLVEDEMAKPRDHALLEPAAEEARKEGNDVDCDDGSHDAGATSTAEALDAAGALRFHHRYFPEVRSRAR